MNHLHGSRRRLLLLAGVLPPAAAAVLSAFLLGRSHGQPEAATTRATLPTGSPARVGRTPAPPAFLAEHVLTSLTAPVQDAAAVTLASRISLGR